MIRSIARLLPFCTLAVALLAPAARANTISGTAFCNISAADASNTPAPGATPSGTECATFTASDLIFYSNGSASTNNLGSFLNFNNEIVGSVNYLNGFDASSSLDNSFYQFTGTSFFVTGQTYTVAHDDGTVMNVDGVTVVNAPSPTSAVDSTFVFSGVTGNYLFTYDYTEQGGISEFGTNATDNPVPEPTSLVFLATGGGLALLYARRRNLSASPEIPFQ